MAKVQTENKRAKIGFWLKWLKSAKKAAKPHWKHTEAAYKEYELAQSSDDGANNLRGYPLYWAACQTLEPAYYSLTPKIISKRKYGIENDLALTMALIAERLGQFLVDNGNFDEAMCAARADFIHAAKATTQVVYTAEMEPSRQPLQVLEQNGEASYYETDPESLYNGEVLKDDAGFYYEKKVAREESQRIFLAPACYDEILHTPTAKTNAEITEIAYKFRLDKETAEKKFNPEGDKTLPYSSKNTDEGSGSDDDLDCLIEELEGWECYCLESKTVYWVCEKYTDGFLHKESDPYGLRKFYPSPGFILSNKKRKSLYTTPTYVYLEATSNQLHSLYERIFSLIDSVRRRALVFNASPELIQALNSLSGQEFIQAGEITDILEKGGIQNLVQYVPVKELVDCLAETVQLEGHFKNNFYEWFGVPDILRGISDPSETAAAQGIKSDAAHDRFKYNKKQMVDLARDSAEMLLDLGLRVLSDQKIAQICGYEYLPSGTPAVVDQQTGQLIAPPKLNHKERFFDALAKLKNDEERLVTIDFETNSTSFRDEAKEQQKQSMLADVVLRGLSTIGGMDNLEFASVALQALLALVAAHGGSKEYEDPIKKAVSELVEKRKQPQPPPPDIEMLKVRVAQMEAQSDAQLKAQELALEGQRNQMEAQIAARELSQQDYKLQLDALKTQSETKVKEMSAMFTAQIDRALLGLEQQRVQIESFKAQIQAQESLLEEVRLRQEADAKVFEQAGANAPNPPSPSPVTPPISINLGPSENTMPRRRVVTPIRDENGNITQAHIEDLVD